LTIIGQNRIASEAKQLQGEEKQEVDCFVASESLAMTEGSKLKQTVEPVWPRRRREIRHPH